MSDLCVMSCEWIFIATGKPRVSAATIASLEVRAIDEGVTGTRNAARTAFDSTSVRIDRPSASTLSMMSCAPAMSGIDSDDIGPGVWTSSS